MSDPTYEEIMVSKSGPRSAVGRFVQALEPGVPTKCDLPEIAGRKLHHVQQQIAVTARQGGFHVRTRTVDGALWVVRLKPEDESDGS